MWRRLKRLWELSGTEIEKPTNQHVHINGSIKPDDAQTLLRLCHKLERQGLR